MFFLQKITSIAVAAILAFSAASSPAAVTSQTADADAILRDRNYPQAYLDLLSPSEKEDLLVKRNLVFEKAVVSGFDQNELIWEYEISDDGTMPYGQIPEADLKLVFGISKNKYNGTANVRYGYDWRNLPFFRGQDPIAVSWDNSKFEMKTDTFKKIDQYRYFDDITKKEVIRTYSSEPGYASASPSGVTWYAKLYPLTPPAYALHGYGEFDLKPKDSGLFSTTFYGCYIHNMASLGVGIVIPGFGQFSISGTGTYDERGSQIDYDYSA